MLLWGAENGISATYLHLSKYTFLPSYCTWMCLCCALLYFIVFVVCICCAFYLSFFLFFFFTKRLRIFDWCKLWYDSYGFWLRQQWFGSDACLLSSVSCSNLEPLGWRLFHDRFANGARWIFNWCWSDDKSKEKKTNEKNEWIIILIKKQMIFKKRKKE